MPRGQSRRIRSSTKQKSYPISRECPNKRRKATLRARQRAKSSSLHGGQKTCRTMSRGLPLTYNLSFASILPLSDDKIKLEATVLKTLPDTKFKVKLDD